MNPGVAPWAAGPDRAALGLKVAAGVAACAALAAPAAGMNPVFVAFPAAVGLIFAVAHRTILAWRTLVAAVVTVILIIPMKRYSLLPNTLPFHIELYRLLIAGVAVCWLGSVLIDPATKIRRTGLDIALAAFGLTVLASIAVNAGRVGALDVGGLVLKRITFLASGFVLVYLISSTITRRRDIDFLVRIIVTSGTIVAICALYESRSGYNVFNHLQTLFPAMRFDGSTLVSTIDDSRGGRLRVRASAEHPIALGAALAILLPLGIYLAHRTGQRRWWLAVALLAFGVLSTVSRTGVLMLLVIGITYAILKPAATRRALPILLPLLIASHVAVPGALGGLKSAFFPAGGVVAEQQYGAGTHGSGRLADFGPSIAEWEQTPLLGQGYATRISDVLDPRQNAPILDDQWLGSLLETGLLGLAGLAWLFVRTIRKLGRAARRDSSAHGWLLAGLAASISGFAAGMWTFDAFGFYQVTLLFFVMIGLSISALRVSGPEAGER